MADHVKYAYMANVLCSCGAGARRLLIKKPDSPNVGEYFYCCAKDADDEERCSFYVLERDTLKSSIEKITDTIVSRAVKQVRQELSEQEEEVKLAPKKKKQKKH